MHENKDEEAKKIVENAKQKKKEIPSVAHDPRCQRGKIATLRFVALAHGQQQAVRSPKPFATLGASHTCQTVNRNSALAYEVFEKEDKDFTPWLNEKLNIEIHISPKTLGETAKSKKGDMGWIH